MKRRRVEGPSPGHSRSSLMPPKKKSKADAQPWSFESIDNAQVTEKWGETANMLPLFDLNTLVQLFARSFGN